MRFKDTLDGEVVVFTVSGKVLNQSETMTMFHGQIHQYINLNKNKIIIDLAKVELMGSVGLGMLISALSTVQKAKGRLVLANITSIQNLIAMTRLNLIFESFDSVDAAKAALTNG